MGASGGAVAASLWVAGNYKRANLRRLSTNVCTAQFIKEWVPILPNGVVGIFNGSLYDHSDSYMSTIEINMSPRILLETEIWLQTYERNHRKTHVYCTKCDGESILNISPAWSKATNTVGPNYINGNICKYATTIKASAAIPGLLPNIYMDGGNHADGGIVYPSPLIPLMDSIIELGKSEELHIIYISGYNTYLEPVEVERKDTILDSCMDTISILINGNVIQDRLNCCNLISHDRDYHEEDITFEEYLGRKNKWKRSFLEIYPNNHCNVDLTALSEGDLRDGYIGQIPNIISTVRYINK
jgi:hypothetical protein